MKTFIKNNIPFTAVLMVSVGLAWLLPASLSEPARRMSFIFIFAALLWAFEIIPIWVTSLLVIVLEIFLLAQPGGVAYRDGKGYAEFMAPLGNPIILLFFGGFILAITLNKYAIDQRIARKLLNLCGSRPSTILLGFMSITALLSMWVSNTATAALMIVMARALIIKLQPDDPFRKSLPLSIAIGANVGGIGTPVGTPPNAIGLGILANQGIRIDFLSWMVMAIPLVVMSLLVAWMILLMLFPPKIKAISFHLETQTDETSLREWMIYFITGTTVILWLTSGFTKIPLAVTALLSATLFFALDFLDKNDLRRVDWDILILMSGGLALGKGMELSGLTEAIVQLPIFSMRGFSLLAAVCFLGLLMSTFMSNTATANLLIPIAVGISGENPLILGVSLAIACSFAMSLPVSTPPNAIAYASETFSTKDLVKTGSLISLFGFVLLVLGGNMMIGRLLTHIMK